jgi:hypothetical protein
MDDPFADGWGQETVGHPELPNVTDITGDPGSPAGVTILDERDGPEEPTLLIE